MATPKYKTSKAKTARRKAINMKLSAPTLTICTTCSAKVLPHRVCPKCGFYRGEMIVDTSDK